eukprot:scaffold4862_cov133-Skeletonema_menzelii.AAC.2
MNSLWKAKDIEGVEDSLSWEWSPKVKVESREELHDVNKMGDESMQHHNSSLFARRVGASKSPHYLTLSPLIDLPRDPRDTK